MAFPVVAVFSGIVSSDTAFVAGRWNVSFSGAGARLVLTHVEGEAIRVAVFSCLRRSSYALRRFGGNRSDFPDHRSERTRDGVAGDEQARPVERERTVVGAPDDSAAGEIDSSSLFTAASYHFADRLTVSGFSA